MREHNSIRPGSISPEVLTIDPSGEANRIETAIRRQLFEELKRRGVVVGLSGGIDSSVVAALSARALGKERVLGLLMPEIDAPEEALRLGRALAEALGIETLLEEITPILKAAGCYERRDEAIRKVIPEYGAGYRCKVVSNRPRGGKGYPIASVVVQAPEGKELRVRLTKEAYLGIISATNLKQRTRKMLEYYHADRRYYAVAGTPNRLEYDLGYFVKNGDGAADLKPIAHLYKSQVYQLAAYLGVPDEIRRRTPTTDLYPLWQSQEESYFSLPFDKMDLCLYGRNHQIPHADLAAAVGLAPEAVALVYRDIDSKRHATRYLHLPPLRIDPAGETIV